MKTVPAMIFTALILGLTWAVRGHFGHEWGAAWAGATGALAVLVASGRIGWLRRLPSFAALGALGWGAGGMMRFLTLLLPWSNYVNAFEDEKLTRLAKRLGIEDAAQEVSSVGPGFVALAAIVFVMIAMVALATTTLHDGKMNFHERFPTDQLPAARP